MRGDCKKGDEMSEKFVNHLLRSLTRLFLYLLISSIFFRLESTDFQKTIFMMSGLLFIMFSGFSDLTGQGGSK